MFEVHMRLTRHPSDLPYGCFTFWGGTLLVLLLIRRSFTDAQWESGARHIMLLFFPLIFLGLIAMTFGIALTVWRRREWPLLLLSVLNVTGLLAFILPVPRETRELLMLVQVAATCGICALWVLFVRRRQLRAGGGTRAAMLLATLMLLGAAVPAYAQSGAGRVPHIGLLGVTSAAGYARQVEALRQGFRDLGYVEGQNLVIEARWADGRYDRLPALAAELVRLQPDVIVTSGPGTRAAKEATATIPIVMAVAGDAVAEGLVASLAHPGGNITGSTFFGPEVSAKRLEILKSAAPRLARIAVLVNPSRDDLGVTLTAVRKTASALSVELFEVPARSPQEFEGAFASMGRQKADGMLVISDSMFVANMRRLGELASARGLPAAGSDEFADGGGLLAYGVHFPELWRRASYFVDRILKGASPGVIPVEQASKFSLVLNRKGAKALGLPLQQSLVLRADQVIE